MTRHLDGAQAMREATRSHLPKAVAPGPSSLTRHDALAFSALDRLLRRVDSAALTVAVSFDHAGQSVQDLRDAHRLELLSLVPGVPPSVRRELDCYLQ